MKLTVDQQRGVAQRANWYFDVFMGLNTGDCAMSSGDGVDDLDILIGRIQSSAQPGFKIMCDIGAGCSTDFVPCDIEDILAIRAYYVGWNGPVNKVDAYRDRIMSAIATDIQAAVSTPVVVELETPSL